MFVFYHDLVDIIYRCMCKYQFSQLHKEYDMFFEESKRIPGCVYYKPSRCILVHFYCQRDMCISRNFKTGIETIKHTKKKYVISGLPKFML